MRLLATLLFLVLFSAKAQKDIPSQIEKCITPYFSSNNFYGTVYVGQGGKVLYHKSFGLSSVELNVSHTNKSVYHLASVSKPFTSSSILVLEQQGKLSTNDVLSKYISDFTDGSKITIYHLLTHTTGIPNINNLPDYDRMSLYPQSLDSIINVFKHMPLEFEPGGKFAYSNSNYNVLAYIIEKVSGMPYGEFLKKNIFSPLQMNSTQHHGDATEVIPNVATGYSPKGGTGLQKAPVIDWTIKTGNGSLVSTAEDLALFDRALYSEKLLAETAREKMFLPHLSETGSGWFIRKHNGRLRQYITGRSPGFSTYFARYPDEQLVVIVLSNLYIPSTSEIGLNLASIVFGDPVSFRDLKSQRLPDRDAAKFAGKYQFGNDFFRPGMIFEITGNDGQLLGPFGELLHDTGNEFIVRNYWSVIRFQEDNGKITGLSFDGVSASKIEK